MYSHRRTPAQPREWLQYHRRHVLLLKKFVQITFLLILLFILLIISFLGVCFHKMLLGMAPVFPSYARNVLKHLQSVFLRRDEYILQASFKIHAYPPRTKFCLQQCLTCSPSEREIQFTTLVSRCKVAENIACCIAPPYTLFAVGEPCLEMMSYYCRYNRKRKKK